MARAKRMKTVAMRDDMATLRQVVKGSLGSMRANPFDILKDHAHEDDKPPRQSPAFLRLPGELRNRCYEEMMMLDSTSTKYPERVVRQKMLPNSQNPRVKYERWNMSPDLEGAMALFLVNKQVSNEFRSLYMARAPRVVDLKYNVKVVDGVLEDARGFGFDEGLEKLLGPQNLVERNLSSKAQTRGLVLGVVCELDDFPADAELPGQIADEKEQAEGVADVRQETEDTVNEEQSEEEVHGADEACDGLCCAREWCPYWEWICRPDRSLREEDIDIEIVTYPSFAKLESYLRTCKNTEDLWLKWDLWAHKNSHLYIAERYASRLMVEALARMAEAMPNVKQYCIEVNGGTELFASRVSRSVAWSDESVVRAEGMFPFQLTELARDLQQY